MTQREDRMYPGSEPFTSADSARFGGRDAEGAELRDLWQSSRVTFLVGPAGIGKTSLLNAKVLPKFELSKPPPLLGRLSDRARYPVALLEGHNPYTLALLRSWSGYDSRHLANDTIADYLRRYAERHPGRPIMAAIDQADDLFAGPAERQPDRRRFLEQVAAALEEDERQQLHLLISIRSDMLDQLSDFLGGGERFHLDPLGPNMAREAVEKPGFFLAAAADELVAAVQSRRFVTGHGEVRQITSERVEPALLQIASARLWDALRAHYPRVVRSEDLASNAQEPVDAALANHYGSVIATVAVVHGVDPGWLRSWLVNTLVTGAGDLQSAPENAGAPATAMRVLEDRHLLRGHGGAMPGGRSYHLLSDKLVEPLRNAPDELPPAEDAADCLLAAERALVTGQRDLAVRYARRALEVAPGDAFYQHGAAYSLLGDLAYERGEFEHASRNYREAIRLFEQSERNYREAIRLLASVIGTNKRVADLYRAMAQTCWARGLHDQAIEYEAESLKWVFDFKLSQQLVTWMVDETTRPVRRRELDC